MSKKSAMAIEASKVLVLGVSGMLGNAIFRLFAQRRIHGVFGSLRSTAAIRYFPAELHGSLVTGVNVENLDNLVRLFATVEPNVVINCIGLVKQLSESDDPLAAIPINALLPHRLARLCQATSTRLVHISTDCVFSGNKGMYKEEDFPDAHDLYGRSKLLGEVDYPNAITLRTSIIGHELNSIHGLIGWFLAQENSVRGFTQAIFSGLPTVELANIIHDFVLPCRQLHGLYHVSAKAISKFELLHLVGKTYAKSIEISRDNQVVIDRSLDSLRFQQLTGYRPPEWPELIRRMYEFQ